MKDRFGNEVKVGSVVRHASYKEPDSARFSTPFDGMLRVVALSNTVAILERIGSVGIEIKGRNKKFERPSAFNPNFLEVVG